MTLDKCDLDVAWEGFHSLWPYEEENDDPDDWAWFRKRLESYPIAEPATALTARVMVRILEARHGLGQV